MAGQLPMDNITESSHSSRAQLHLAGSRSKAEVRGPVILLWWMRSVNGCVMAPLVHHEVPYSSERPWNMTTVHQDSTLSRVNWLQFSTTSGSWMRQPSMFQQSQPLSLRPGSSSFSRDVRFVEDSYPSIRASGYPRDKGPSSQQEDWESSRDRPPPSDQGHSGGGGGGAPPPPPPPRVITRSIYGVPMGDDRHPRVITRSTYCVPIADVILL